MRAGSVTFNTCARLMRVVPVPLSKGKKPASKFMTSPTRSGPVCSWLPPARKKNPDRVAPVTSVNSAASRRFSTRNSDIGSKTSIDHNHRRVIIQIRDGIAVLASTRLTAAARYARYAPYTLYALLALFFCWPLFEQPLGLGANDWDQHLFYYGAVLKNIVEYGQAPFWNPWYCGGNV